VLLSTTDMRSRCVALSDGAVTQNRAGQRIGTLIMHRYSARANQVALDLDIDGSNELIMTTIIMTMMITGSE